MQDAKAIQPLTSLRFFAAMWVVAFHYWPNLSPVLPPLVAKGYLGVELFFVLSGFILCHVYLDSVADGGFRYGSFLWARLARIYPLHLATLAGIGAMALAALAAGVSYDWKRRYPPLSTIRRTPPLCNSDQVSGSSTPTYFPGHRCRPTYCWCRPGGSRRRPAGTIPPGQSRPNGSPI